MLALLRIFASDFTVLGRPNNFSMDLPNTPADAARGEVPSQLARSRSGQLGDIGRDPLRLITRGQASLAARFASYPDLWVA